MVLKTTVESFTLCCFKVSTTSNLNKILKLIYSPRCAAARMMISWFRIPLEAWMFVCCECCVLSGRGLCDELATRPEESYRLWCVLVCDIETSSIRSQTSIIVIEIQRDLPAGGDLITLVYKLESQPAH
jgi:hypothetical protein